MPKLTVYNKDRDIIESYECTKEELDKCIWNANDLAYYEEGIVEVEDDDGYVWNPI